MLLEDEVKDAINSVSFEKLCRKAYGIASAFREVEKQEDWRKPTSAPKTWRSKVNHELWKRIDPARSGAEDAQFANRRLEDEVRK